MEFRARAMTDGCEGNLLSAAAPPVQASLAVNGPERGPKTPRTGDPQHALKETTV